MRNLSWFGRLTATLAVAACTLALNLEAARAASAGKSGFVEAKASPILSLAVGKSMTISAAKPITRVSVAAPEIADLMVLSPQQIYVVGKAPGMTSIALWCDDTMQFATYDVEVSPDVAALKEKLHLLLPEEKGLRVMGTHDGITLAGAVSSTARLSQATELAKIYAPKDKLVNLLQVEGVQQVMVEVRVAEISRSLIDRLGINFSYIRGQDFFTSTLGSLTTVVKPDDANIFLAGQPFGMLVGPAVNALFRFNYKSANWPGFIDALKEDGLLKVLAEPNLIALSGHSANFLAGGEYPIPVPQGLGTVGIEYKTYGVGLTFTPTVLSDKRISMKVAPEVSDLDYTVAIQIQGFIVPGLTTRRASTVIELADGQSFAIAGLLKDSVRESISKYPLLGDIPILGALFRSSKFQKNETELIIIATPHLVKPLDMNGQSLPTDSYVEPTEAEFLLWGLMEGKEKAPPGAPVVRGRLDGSFGHGRP